MVALKLDVLNTTIISIIYFLKIINILLLVILNTNIIKTFQNNYLYDYSKSRSRIES